MPPIVCVPTSMASLFSSTGWIKYCAAAQNRRWDPMQAVAAMAHVPAIREANVIGLCPRKVAMDAPDIPPARAAMTVRAAT